MMQVYFQTTDGEVSNPEWDEKLSRHWQPLRRLKLSDSANYPKPCDGFEPSEGCIELFNTQTNANLLREGQRFINIKDPFMKLSRILMILAVAITSFAFSQNRELETESAVMTEHRVTVKGKRFPYQATAGTQPVWDKYGKAIA